MNAAKREEIFRLLCAKAAQVVAKGGDPAGTVPIGSSAPEFFLDTAHDNKWSNPNEIFAHEHSNRFDEINNCKIEPALENAVTFVSVGSNEQRKLILFIFSNN